MYVCMFVCMQWRRKVPKKRGGGGGGGTDTYIYVHSVKNQYKRDVIEYMVIYVMVIETFHKIINWYVKKKKFVLFNDATGTH